MNRAYRLSAETWGLSMSMPIVWRQARMGQRSPTNQQFWYPGTERNGTRMVLSLSLELILDSEHEKIYVYLKGQRIGNVHIVWRRTPVGQVVCIADPLQEIQFIGFQRGFRLLKVPMAPCHNDNCPSWSSDSCKLTNKLVQESVNNSSTAQSFASKQCTEKNPK
jgi:hypothetical protein